MDKKYICTAAILLAASISAGAQNVSINARNKSAESVFSEIMRQTGKNFIYSADLLKGMNISVNVSNRPLKEVLDDIFKNSSVVYKIKGNNVTLSRKKVKETRKFTVSGFIREDGSGEPLVGATVYDTSTGKGTSTNVYGFYSLTLPEGETSLKINYVGFDPILTGKFRLASDESRNFGLSTSHQLEEVIVTGSVNNSKALDSSEIGSLNLTNGAIKATPVIFGESDVIKTLQLEPGVSAGIEGLAGMYVHGGDADENLFMLDNIPLYQVNHFGGLFSAFNTEAIRNVDFYKSSFPAKYDGRLSSFMDVHTKDGSLKEHHGSVRLGLTSGAFDINGPIWKDRTTYSLALRRSWFDVITVPALAIVNKLNHEVNTHFRYDFTDFNAKINHHFSEKSSGYVMFYYGEDYLKAGEDDKGKALADGDYDPSWGDNNGIYGPVGMSRALPPNENGNTDKRQDYYDDHARLYWGNIVASAGWKYVFSPKLYGEVTGAFSRYFSSLKNVNESGEMVNDNITEYTRDTYSHRNNITDWIARADFNWLPSLNNKVDFGVKYTFHNFLPTKGERSLYQDNVTTTVVDNVPNYHANELNAYISDDLTLGDIVRINAGLNYSLFSINKSTHSSLSPRFAVRVTPAHNWAVKVGYARTAQFVHQLAESSISLPTDQWVPIVGEEKPQTADNLSAGVYWSTPDKQFTVSVEAYYKWMHNLLEYSDYYYLIPPHEAWGSKLTSGKGRAKGIDIKVTREFGKITGHIAYSLLWSDRKFAGKNCGEWFPSRFDNRHKINVVLSWKINSKWEIGASWTGMSGNRITLPLQCWDDPELGPWHFDMIYPEEMNNYRLPFYHRLDLSATRHTRNGYWTFSLYNAYCNMNVIAVRRDSSNKDYYDDKGNYVYVPSFQHVKAIPIIPSVSYTWLF